jgi:hypothetical protein
MTNLSQSLNQKQPGHKFLAAAADKELVGQELVGRLDLAGAAL